MESFHRYSIYNGVKSVQRRRKSLGMAKMVAEDWASLLLNEKTQISAGEFQDRLEEILQNNRWYSQANRLLEIAFAGGTGALVEYAGPDGLPVIDYIRADMIYPIAWENGVITECAFGSVRMVEKVECVYLQIHKRGPTGYVIENHLFDNKTGEEIEDERIESEIPTNSQEPLFQIIMPNIANNVDLDCPMGISVYANAIPVLQSLDLIYDSYCNEFDLGRKRIFLPLSMARIEDAGMDPQDRLYKPVFDTRDTVFYTLPAGQEGNEGKPIEINMSLRVSEHQTALQDNLNLLSLKCGMGTDRYSFGADGVKTATEVISEKSDLFQGLKKHEHVLTDALVGMVKALAYLSGAPEPEVSVMYDDGIINDDNAKIDNNIKLVQAELKSRLSAIMDIYGLDDAAAEKELQRIIEEGRSISGSDIDLYGAEDAQPGDDAE